MASTRPPGTTRQAPGLAGVSAGLGLEAWPAGAGARAPTRCRCLCARLVQQVRICASRGGADSEPHPSRGDRSAMRRDRRGAPVCVRNAADPTRRPVAPVTWRNMVDDGLAIIIEGRGLARRRSNPVADVSAPKRPGGHVGGQPPGGCQGGNSRLPLLKVAADHRLGDTRPRSRPRRTFLILHVNLFSGQLDLYELVAQEPKLATKQSSHLGICCREKDWLSSNECG